MCSVSTHLSTPELYCSSSKWRGRTYTYSVNKLRIGAKPAKHSDDPASSQRAQVNAQGAPCACSLQIAPDQYRRFSSCRTEFRLSQAITIDADRVCTREPALFASVQTRISNRKGQIGFSPHCVFG